MSQPQASPQPRPPSQEQVVARAVCLAGIVVRGYFEQMIQLLDNPALKHAHINLAAKLNGWLKQQGFAKHLTVAEGARLARPFGSWPNELVAERENGCEALGVLLWALSNHPEIPPYDQPFGLPDFDPLIGFPRDELGQPSEATVHQFPRLNPQWLQEQVQLRPVSEIEAVRGTAESWLWRAHLAISQANETPLPEGQDYPSLIAAGAQAAFESGAIPEPQDGDFVLFGKRYVELTPEQVSQAFIIANARNTALQWLGGYATDWDDVSR
jgi:hypothetical protein